MWTAGAWVVSSNEDQHFTLLWNTTKFKGGNAFSSGVTMEVAGAGRPG